MPYTYDESTSDYIFSDASGSEVFRTKRIGILVQSGQIVKHGPSNEIGAIAQQMIHGGQQVTYVDLGAVDLNDINKKIVNSAH